jgi:hypothetical protein
MNGPSQDDDLQAIAPALTARLGGGALMLSGLLTALLGLQLALSVRGTGLFGVMPFVWMALGIGTIAIGWQVSRAREWAALTGATAGALLSVGHLVWLIVSFSNGLFSLLAIGNLPLAFAASLGAVLAMPACRRATAARERLRAVGLDVGI